MPNRLSDMEYDEVSVVDTGACDDADVVLFKRGTPVLTINLDKAAPMVQGVGTVQSSGYKKKKQSNVTQVGNRQIRSESMRAQHWDESKHPRIKSGPGGGEFSATSAASKEKYGKGGTAKDNLPKEYKPKNDSSGLAHGISADQQKLLNSGSGSGGGKGSKSKNTKTKKAKSTKASAAKAKAAAKQTAQDAATMAAEINGLNRAQRVALRQKGQKAPTGYQWYGDRLISVRQAKLAAMVAGKPKNRIKKNLVVGDDGRIKVKTVNQQLQEWLFATEGGNLA